MLLTQNPKGTKDVLPQESGRWQAVEARMREAAARAGFREVRTPVFEHTELFARGIGDTTDVVQKEMYTFEDKGGRSVTLKPEGTAGAVRAFAQAGLFNEPLPAKMYYLNAPIFRYENPQNGRLREHHQFGLECFGAQEATADAELIILAYRLIEGLGIHNLSVNINSIGCPNCRPAYHDKLKDFLRNKYDTLCPTCKTRFEKNPLRVIDCKEPGCKVIVKDAPSMLDMLCDECAAHFALLQQLLTAAGIPFKVDSHIVRGLDYYTKTVFELITTTPQGELTVCGGGRYDHLVEQIGGKPTPAVGFGMGIERLLLLLEQEKIDLNVPPVLQIFVAAMGEEAKVPAFLLTQRLRAAGIRADLDHTGRSAKAQFKYANNLGVAYVAILGGDELERGVVKVRSMTTREETDIPLENADQEILKLLSE